MSLTTPPPPPSATVAGGGDSHLGSYGVLLHRLYSLEASHEKLKEQFDVLVQVNDRLISNDDDDDEVKESSLEVGPAVPGERRRRGAADGGGSGGSAADDYSNWAYIPGTFSGTLHQRVLQYMGHAVHISRPDSGEIILWNRSAEKLYGYKDYEALGQDESLIVDERYYEFAGKVMERLSFMRFWSGQFPYKKRSGEIFIALVTKTPLYEHGERVGIITVSSSAAVFNDIGPENARLGQDPTERKSRGMNFRKLQWQPPPLIASSVSNLASKVLSRKGEDNEQDGPKIEEIKEQNEMDGSPDVKPERPPRAPATKSRFINAFSSAKNTLAGERPENEESSSNENSPPLKFAQKVFAKLGSFSKGKSGNSTQDGPHDASFSKQTPVEPSSPEAKPRTNLYNHTSHSQYHAGALGIDERPHRVKESEPLQKSDSVSPGERSNGFSSLSSKADKESKMNAHHEINWEDLQLCEEVGQGSFAVVYHGIWNGSDVAVKVYHGTEYNEETLLGYSQELDIMRRLRHPNVLLFMGAVCSNERLALVTEFLPRGSLYKAMHRSNQHLDTKRRLKMALDVARGMNYLHRRNPPIVHRDLKSSNLLVDKSWTVKVGDFGLSKLKEATFLTAKSGRGTPQWMAPEVLRNEHSTEK
ncbi:OLC1v1029580C1 [Oldenlandia corymbosa var. corymbosa]|nr:OLC1v1029580C1 [Oldenlandia corymbosa var. corymbosa]